MQQKWEYKTIEIKPSFLGLFDASVINEKLQSEGQQGWELVNALSVAPMRPILLFLKRAR
jgi:hypothetical protein